MDFLDELDELNLPKDKYVIFGSGPLAIRNIRKNKDIDIVVTKDLWEELSQHYKINKNHFIYKNIEIWNQWFDLDVDMLFREKEIIKGYPFVNLKTTHHAKSQTNRVKDKKDIVLIKRYLASGNNYLYK